MKGKMKRTLARLLVVIMVVSMMPVTGYGATSSGVWMVGSTSYDELQTAVDNVPENGTIIMQEDFTNRRTPIDAKGKRFTIDLGGNTLTNGSSVTWNDADGVTIKNGTLTANMEVIRVPSGSLIILENVMVNNNSSNYGAITVESGGELQIVTGTFSVPTNCAQSVIQVETDGTVTWGRQTAIPTDWEDAKSFTAELTTDFQATLDGVRYARLSEALADAQNGSEVVLLKDVLGISINDTGKSFTLDLNKRTVGGSGNVTAEFMITTSGSITVKNGTVICDEPDWGALSVYAGNVTIEDVSFTNLNSDSYAIENAGAVHIKSGTFTSANTDEGAIYTAEGATTTVDTGSIVEPSNWKIASSFTATYNPVVEVRDSETATTGTKYADIETAIGEGAGKYLYLLKDMSEVKDFTLNEPTTFNLNGYTLTMKAGAYINIFDPITLKNGTIKLLDKDSTGGIYIQPSNNTDIINFDDVKVLSELSVLAVVASGNLVLGAGDYEASEGIKTGFEVYESATLTIKDGYATDLPEEEWTAFSSMHIGTSIEGDKYVISGLEESYIYKGEPVTPAITVKSVTTDRPLAVQQYNAVFSDNDKLGKAKVTIIGKNNFGGKLEADFNLLPCPPENITVTPYENAPDSALVAAWTHAHADQVAVYKVELYDGYDKLKEVTTSAQQVTFSGLNRNKEYKVVVTPGVNIDNVTTYGQTADPAFGTTVSKLDAPTGVSLTTVASSGYPKLTWDKVDGADKYEVWRKVGSDGTYAKQYTTTGTSYTNTSAKPGTVYYYKVKAIDQNNAARNSAFSAAKSIACDLAKPTGVSLTTVASSGYPKLTWNKVEGADKYEVWRKVGSDGTYARQYTTTGTSYTNSSAKPGTIYYYKVKAICGKNSGGNSAFSAAKSIACDLAKPTGLKVTTVASSGKPKVTWNKVDGATKYEVWRKVGSNGTYTKFYTTTGTSVTNTSAEAGTAYYYKVKAICGKNSGGNSAFSASDYVTCDLAAPKITVSGTKKPGKIVVSWSKVTGADRYYIYRATSKNGTYSKYSSTTSTTWTNTSVTEGKYYYYKVKAVYDGKSAANSAYSNMDYAWVR